MPPKFATAKSPTNKTGINRPSVGPHYHRPDKKFILALAALMTFGLVMLFSASSVAAYLRSGNSLYFFNHQLLGLLIGLPLFIIISRIDYHIWRKYALHFLIISIFLLLLVFIPSLSLNYDRANNWINLFGFSLQPSEFVKLFFLLYLAAWLEIKKDKLADLHQGIGPFLAIFAVISFLILKQPDLGTLSIIFAISMIAFFVAGGRARHVAGIILLGIVGIFIIVSFKANKMDRIKCYQHPELHSSDICYQVDQSLIAVGSGGFWGRGLGESRQKFMYLPEVWSDSIFPIIAEEIGFVFCVVLIGLFLFLVTRGFTIARGAPDLYGQVLAAGLISWVIFQAFLNIGGAINLIPMTGVPLPFISSGDSALVALAAGMGILVNISRQTK